MSDHSRDMMRSKRDRLLERLVQTSYRETDTPTFPLSSGKRSRYYIDGKMALSHAQLREWIADLMLEKLHYWDIQAVGGLALGAYPLAIAVSDTMSRLHNREVRAFVVRKEPKSHGLQKYLEGEVHAGEHILIVDDVITTGASTLLAIRKSQEAGLKVVQALAIVDRQEDNGRVTIEQEGISFDALFTLSELSQVYRMCLERPVSP